MVVGVARLVAGAALLVVGMDIADDLSTGFYGSYEAREASGDKMPCLLGGQRR